MTFFSNLLASEGADPRAMFGLRNTQTQLSKNVVFKQINQQDMRAIYEFYNSDTDVSHILHLKDSLSLIGGINFYYGDQKIDTEEYSITNEIIALLKVARKWHDMFGFFAVCNPVHILDRAEDMAEEERLRNANGITPEELALDEVRDIVSEIGSRAVKARINAMFGGGDKRSKKAVEKSRTLEETIRDLGRLRPVSLDDGLFYLQHDTLTGAKKVVFVRGAIETTATPDIAANIDQSVYVHVWDERMPSSAGIVNTQMREVIRHRIAMDDAFHNKARADFWASHPFVFLEQETPQFNTNARSSTTDADLFEGSFEGHHAREQELRIETEITNRFMLGAQADVQNGRVMSQLQAAINSRITGSTQRNALGQAIPLSLDRRMEVQLLPPQVRVSSMRVEHSTVLDSDFMRFQFRSTLAKAMNFPLSAMDAGINFTPSTSRYQNSQSSFANNEQIKELTKNEINADRAMLANFFNNLWDLMYRDIDTRTLTGVLAKIATDTQKETDINAQEIEEIEENISQITEISEQLLLKEKIGVKAKIIDDLLLRLRDAQTRIRAVLSMQYRFTIEFFAFSHLTTNDLNQLRQAGSISHYEFANTMRLIANLPPLTEAELKNNMKEMLEKETAKRAAEEAGNEDRAKRAKQAEKRGASDKD
jgi:hypothetical protein